MKKKEKNEKNEKKKEKNENLFFMNEISFQYLFLKNDFRNL